MADNRHSNIFSDTECISMETMERYTNDQLPSIEQQAVENHLVDCALCADALEGLTMSGFSTDVEDRIVSLNERIASKTPAQKEGFWKKKYMSYAAAIIGIMVLSGVLLNTFKTSEIAQQKLISEDIPIESKPPPAKKDVAGSDTKDTRSREGEAALDDLEFGENLKPTTGEGLDLDQGDVPVEELERTKNTETVLEDQDEASRKWSDNRQRDLSTKTATGGQGHLQSGFSTIVVEQTIAEEDEESDNRRLSELNGMLKDEKAKKKETRFAGNGLSVDGDKLSGDAADLAGNADYFYRADQIVDESKEEESQPADQLLATLKERSTAAPTSSTSTSDNNIVSRELLNEDVTVQTARGKAQASAQDGKKGENKSIAEKKKSDDDFAFQDTEKGKKRAQKGAAISGKRNEVEAEKSLEYDDAMTLYNAVIPTTDEPVMESLSKVGTNEISGVPAGAAVSDPAPLVIAGGIAPEQAPRFQGGEANLRQYLIDNMVYPDSAIQLGIDCKVFVSFTVNADSTISDAIILKPIGGGCDEEALRLINKMPNWEPAQQKGRKVKAQYNLEIDFESIK